MTEPVRHQIIKSLQCVNELSPDVRFGQLIANLAFLVEDSTGQSLWEIADDELLCLIENHKAVLAHRQSKTA